MLQLKDETKTSCHWQKNSPTNVYNRIPRTSDCPTLQGKREGARDQVKCVEMGGGPQLCSRYNVLIKGLYRRRQVGQSQRRAGHRSRGWEGGRTTRQGMRAASRSRKSKKTEAPPDGPEGTQPCQHLHSNPTRPMSLWPPERYGNKSAVFSHEP